MSELSDWIPDYAGSEHFMFLDAPLQVNAEALLALWCAEAGGEPSVAAVDDALRKVALVEAPAATRRAFPQLLKAFLGYLDDVAHVAAAPQWLRFVEHAEQRYVDGFRADGTVRGETVRKQVSAVGRNDPCPCGSGKKFKKCCMTT